MPIEIKYTEDNLGINFYAVGEVTGNHIIEGMKEIFQSEKFVNLKYWIADRSRCTKYDVSSDDVKLIADLDKEAAKINPDLLMILISDTELQYGMSRMYEIYSADSGFKTSVFKDRYKAEDWLKKELDKSQSK
jgi:hypothetical protein